METIAALYIVGCCAGNVAECIVAKLSSWYSIAYIGYTSAVHRFSLSKKFQQRRKSSTEATHQSWILWKVSTFASYGVTVLMGNSSNIYTGKVVLMSYHDHKIVVYNILVQLILIATLFSYMLFVSAKMVCVCVCVLAFSFSYPLLCVYNRLPHTPKTGEYIYIGT